MIINNKSERNYRGKCLGWPVTSYGGVVSSVTRESLNRTTRSDPSLLANSKLKALLPGREGGKF